MRISVALTLLLLCCARAVPAADWHYRANLDAATEQLEVQVCAPTSAAALRLQATDALARDYLSAATRADWVMDADRTHMRWQGAGTCARYSVDLRRLADARRIGHGYRIGGDLLLWPQALIWWPADTTATITLDLELPAGWQASVPWPAVQSEGAQTGARAAQRYRLDGWPRDWPGLIALGHFQPVIQRHGGGAVALTVLGALPDEQRARLVRWADHSAGLLDQVTAGLPIPAVQVLVVPIPGNGGGPVPWGQNSRAGWGGVHFFVHPDLPYQDFIDDWTAAHEFSHLLHPYFGSQDRWMGEGLASYYQNVLRARGGDLSPESAWDKLIAGFERGRKDRAQQISLRAVAEDMREQRAFMRVYWSGAAFWFAADVELRQRSGGKLTLDDALTRFARCCAPARRQWSAREFATKLDQLIGIPVFAGRTQAAAAAQHFPDLDPLYRTLGLQLDAKRAFVGYADGTDPAMAALRSAIMAPRR